MKITEQADLQNFNTFGVAAKAGLMLTVETEEDLLSLPPLNHSKDLVLGGGSNILLVADVPGSVFLNRIRGVSIVEEHDDRIVLEVGAGENWHDLVVSSVRNGWFGLENLALIPGLAGAAPIQNIGAYGTELSDVLLSVTAWDWRQQNWAVFPVEECQLAYRDSLFKHQPRDRYLITSIRLALSRRFRPRLDYSGIVDQVSTFTDPESPSAEDVMRAVISLRQQKLPDPEKFGNAGSFFKNPVVRSEVAGQLRRDHPDMPTWPAENDQVKIPAAWLIQESGLKTLRYGAAAVSQQHALVLINTGGATGAEIWQLALNVQQQVRQRFGIELEPEPRIHSGGEN